MLSISKPLNSSSAEKYYERDNYYLESQGLWFGKLAADLGLSGEIKETDFSNLLRGFATDGTTKLVESAGQLYKHTEMSKHRSGIDLTFSAPKSVSILSYSDDRIEAAFHRALHNTLSHAEDEFTQTRKKTNKKVSYEKTQNALYSTFTHRTSRELDPQLHAHCILFNLTKSQNGQIMTVHNDKFYLNKMYLGQYFRNSLASEIKNIGYDVEITDRKNGFFEIKGVEKGVIDAFSTRRKQVKEEVEKLRELRFCNLYSDNIAKWAAERTAKYADQADYAVILEREIENLSSSKDKVYAKWDDAELASLATTNSRIPKKNVTKEVILEQIDATCSGIGTSLSEVVTSAQSQNIIEKVISSESDIIMQAVDGLTENHSTFTKQDILNRAFKLSIGDYSYKDLFEAYDKMLASGKLVHLGESIKSSGKDNVYTSSEIKNIERNIIDVCRNSIGSSNVKVDRGEAKRLINLSNSYLKLRSILNSNEHSSSSFDELLQSLSDNSLKNYLRELRDRLIQDPSTPLEELIDLSDQFNKSFGLEDFIDKNGRGFTPGQYRALEQIVATDHQVSIIQGSAGVGKSFSCKYARKFLEENGFTVRGIAPTGKAADELAQASGINHATTLHDFILRYENMDSDKKDNLFNKGKECFIVDEASMIGSRNAHKIISIAKELDAKIVFIGDKKQFQSIEAGNVFKELMNRSGIDVTYMNDVLRQKTEQTKEVVAAISEKDYTAAFNYLQGYKKSSDFDKSVSSNYQVGQMLCFDEDAISVPAGTVAHVSSINDDSITIDFDSYVYENSRRFKKHFSVSFDPSRDDEFQTYRVFNPSSLENEPYENVVHEIEDDDERLQVVADDYLSCYSDGKKITDAVVITPTNDERVKLNSIIRKSLVDMGIVEDGTAYTLRESHNLDGSASRFADSYNEGQVVIINKSFGDNKRGKEGRISSIDIGRNELTVEFPGNDDSSGYSSTFNVSKHADKFSVYNEVKNSLGVNDQIAFLKNDEFINGDKKVRVRNGQIATILNIDNQGNVDARIGKENSGRTVSFNINGKGRNGFNYITPAYCLSEMKSQGITVDKIIANANSSKHISANSFYVSVTRCSKDISIYTDCVDELKQKIQVEQIKVSSLDFDFSPEKTANDNHMNSVDDSMSDNEKFIDSFLDELDQNFGKDKSVEYSL